MNVEEVTRRPVWTFLVEREGAFYVSRCPQLGVASFGDDEQEAHENLADAIEVYVDTLEDLGIAKHILKDARNNHDSKKPKRIKADHPRGVG